MPTATETIDTQRQFQRTPRGQARRWGIEISAARANQRKWWEDAELANKEFLGERGGSGKRLNLFYADVTTKAANMSGLPTVRARRRFADAADDVARVSAEMLERLLNSDIERDGMGFREALAAAKGDWLRTGLGVIRLRYVAEFGKEPAQPAMTQTDPATGQAVEVAPAVPEREVKTFEDVESAYIHWRDFLWSPCRHWEEATWIAFRSELTKDEADQRFPQHAGRLPAKSNTPVEVSDDIRQVWSRVEVWEIWDRETRNVIWFCEGYDQLLDVKSDPLGLTGFFPCPRPLVANATTDKFMPRPSYFLAEDLYQEAHELTARIRSLVKACKVAGVYDQASQGVQRLLDEACENELIPLANWAAFVEKGGVKGAIDFLPLEQFIAALVQLVQQRNLVKQDLYEVTGQSDIMRGQAAAKATATEQRIKARFGSSRIQADQSELARFASEAQQIRAHIISKLFDEGTILQRSNIGATVDAGQAAKAVELLRSDISQYRIEVDDESLSMTDFDAVQQEGVAIMAATADFFQRWTPLMQSSPQIAQFALEMFKVFITGFRGAERFEGIIDRAIEQLKQIAAQPKPPPQPDPRMQAAEVKAKADVQKTGMEMQRAQLEHGIKMREMAAEVQADRAKAQLRMAAQPSWEEL